MTATQFEAYDPNPPNRPPPFQGRIRLAHAADSDAAASLTIHDVDAMAGLQHERDGIPLDVAREQRTKELTDPGFGEDRVVFIAEEDTQIVGYARARHVPPLEEVEPVLRPPSGWYLLGVIVHPEHRRRGIGRALTATRLDWVRERAAEIFYFTRGTNRTSIALHEAFGFEACRDDFFFPRTGLQAGDGVMYRLTL